MSLSQVGMEMVVPIVVGLLMDRWLGTTPWLMVGGVVLGFVGGFAHLMAILQRIDRTDAEKPRDRP